MKQFKLRNGSTMQFDGAFATVEEGGKTIAIDGAISNGMINGVMDADGAFFFQRQLEHIKAKSYDVVYADLPARSLFPVSNDGGMGVTSIVYRTYDQSGTAKIINSYASDLPRADVAGKETRIPVRALGIAYAYNIDEIQASQLTGAALDQRRANAARRSIEQRINDISVSYTHLTLPTKA